MSTSGDDATREQMLAWSERLAAGARALRTLPADLRRGATPSRCVHALDRTRLLRYERVAPRSATLPPLLVVYALVNRPYLLDLEPDRSFVLRLLESGRDVFLVDWGAPGMRDSGLGLDDYVLRYLDGHVRHLAERHGGPVDLLGVCQGGTFSLCHAALEPDRIRRLALLVTPVDFAVETFLLARWTRDVDVARMVQRLGNVPGALLNAGFLCLRPLSLTGRKSLNLLDVMHDPEQLATFARMEQWLADSPDQAGRAFREFVEVFVRGNGLVAGTAEIGGRAVDLGSIRAPVLNLFAGRDHIVPPASSQALRGLLSGRRYTEEAFDAGHIGLFTSRSAQAVVPRVVCEWFAAPG